MKAYTKHVKDTYKHDISKNRYRNWRRLTPQGAIDRHSFYTRKWESLLEDATTDAQKKYCIRFLIYINNAYLWFKEYVEEDN